MGSAPVLRAAVSWTIGSSIGIDPPSPERYRKMAARIASVLRVQVTVAPLTQRACRLRHRRELLRGHVRGVHRPRGERAETAIGVHEQALRGHELHRRADTLADLRRGLDLVGARVHDAEPELLLPR